MIDFIVLAIGLAVLWAGTELSVQNATVLAQRFKLSNLVIGMSVVAFGTDLPELVVAINGAIDNLAGSESSGVIVGNAVGSCICQISFVVGIVAIFHQFPIEKKQVSIMTIGLGVAWIALFLVALNGVVGRAEGAILITLFLGYIFFLFYLRRQETEELQLGNESSNTKILPFLLLCVGLVLVAFGAEVVVEKAVIIAAKLGVQQSFVGAVIVALGTSLPELAISVSAALKNKPGIALGNIVGSNIFDLLIPIGAAAVISGVKFAPQVLWFDMPYLLMLSVLFVLFLRSKSGIQRREGICLVALYVLYLIIQVVISRN